RANLSRTVTEYISDMKRREESSAENIKDLQARQPKLKKVIETPWAKAAEFEEKSKELAEVERQMAERGTAPGNPQMGLPIEQYQDVVTNLDDVGDKDDWAIGNGILWPIVRGEDPQIAIRKPGLDLNDFTGGRGKVKPALADRWRRPDILQILDMPLPPEPPSARPFAYTVVDQKTRFWARAGGDNFVTVDPQQFRLLERMLGKKGSWRYDKPSGMGGHYLVHVDESGVKDAFILGRLERNVPSGVKELAGKSSTSEAGREEGTPSFKLESPRVPPFYSALRRTIEQKMAGSMPVKQLQALLKQPGIKQEEVKWSGIDDFLAGKEGKIAKREVLDFLERNRIQVREVLKGEKAKELSWQTTRDGSYSADDESGAVWEALPKGSKSGWQLFRDGNPYGVFETAARAMMRAEEDADFGPTKFGRFTVPGGKNYRELLFTLPSRGVVNGTDGDVRRFHDLSLDLWNEISERERNQLRSEYRKITGGKERAGFRSSHWNEPNVLAHARFNERTDAEGKRVLFIEEIQSDWHQEGRKKGYAGNREGWEVRKGSGLNPWQAFYKNEPRRLSGPTRKAVWDLIDKEGTPPAPLAKTWHEFVLKRMIRWAAENGFDRIAWTTGEQQADRYNLAKAVNRIEWEKTEPGEEKGIVTLSIAPRDVPPEDLYREIGQRTGLHWDTDPDAGPLLYVPADRLDEVIGKDLAKRILEDPADMGSFEGESLKIGGEGMKGFYDKIIPDFLNKFGKKWGAKVEESEIETGIMPGDAENNLPLVESEDPLQLLPDTVLRSVSSFPITPSMKESALTEGFPLFMPERSSWSDKTASVVPHSTIEKLKSHPDYGAAKAGDRRAGLRLARDLMKPEKISELKESLAKEKQVIIIAPVRMREAGLDNAIPPLMAEVISNQTGWQVDTSIIQINDVA
ncbi:MAG: hypothetical protein H6Q44_2105, partial [Deltaproteobacteria bacterium]|nr:hypothetical protein [Deltaproteobacteria bacterium]